MKPKQYSLSRAIITITRETFALRDEPWPMADTPERIANAIAAHIESQKHGYETERFFVVLLTTRLRILDIVDLSTGTLDTILVHPREVFRPAIVENAHSIVLSHVHPSGDAAPSETDIKITRQLIQAGQLLKIEVLDHVIVGNPTFAMPGTRAWSSLRELGYFYS